MYWLNSNDQEAISAKRGSTTKIFGIFISCYTALYDIFRLKNDLGNHAESELNLYAVNHDFVFHHSDWLGYFRLHQVELKRNQFWSKPTRPLETCDNCLVLHNSKHIYWNRINNCNIASVSRQIWKSSWDRQRTNTNFENLVLVIGSFLTTSQIFRAVFLPSISGQTEEHV